MLVVLKLTTSCPFTLAGYGAETMLFLVGGIKRPCRR